MPDKTSVFRRVAHFLLIAALLGATGAHWAVLQSVAWATMLADHSRMECLADAVSDTFDGKHPCPICKKIAESRKAESKSDLQAGPNKLEFSHEAVCIALVAPSNFTLLPQASEAATLLARTPPVPPPRSLQG